MYSARGISVDSALARRIETRSQVLESMRQDISSVPSPAMCVRLLSIPPDNLLFPNLILNQTLAKVKLM